MSDRKYIEATSAINGDLCDFSNRWTLDGDYLRCRFCNRAQITNYMDSPFPHAGSCKPTRVLEPQPWRTFLALTTELARLAAPQADGLGGKGGGNGVQ
ncbi:hypothetical protein GT347_20070 [Xylophilus rhododendri]|uniref:Uncharacterized protein n=1 Tax=Xylophilus rhododendri TaxID=2697032 RepID=A0A857JAA6_9BURK|nr:hypothetical protein [Xylophilus rhododendri]QHJ00072.1 hypothetical protein GT347_20070 [Xylophilus rhododendri]